MSNMISGAGSSALGGGYTGQSSTSLEAKLSQYKQKLADWVSCPSSKTPEGKAKIKEFSDKVSDTQKRIQTIQTARQEPPSASAAIKTPVISQTDSSARPNTSQHVLEQASARSASFTSTVGSRVNVFA